MERARTNHERLWAAIDAIATRHGLSPSGLARRAGLDATAFNKSKRFTADGRPRWPSTESIAKILAATGCELIELVRLVDARAARRSLGPFSPRPASDFPGFHEEGGEAEFPDGSRPFEVADHGMAPFYRKGDVLIVSSQVTPRPGDRVLLTIDDGAPQACVFLGREETGYRVEPIGGGECSLVADARLSSFARILWASQ